MEERIFVGKNYNKALIRITVLGVVFVVSLIVGVFVNELAMIGGLIIFALLKIEWVFKPQTIIFTEKGFIVYTAKYIIMNEFKWSKIKSIKLGIAIVKERYSSRESLCLELDNGLLIEIDDFEELEDLINFIKEICRSKKITFTEELAKT